MKFLDPKYDARRGVFLYWEGGRWVTIPVGGAGGDVDDSSFDGDGTEIDDNNF